MSVNDYNSLVKRLKKSAFESMESAMRILGRKEEEIDGHSLRAAASQCNQAAKDLNQLDGVLQAMAYLKMKE